MAAEEEQMSEPIRQPDTDDGLISITQLPLKDNNGRATVVGRELMHASDKFITTFLADHPGADIDQAMTLIFGSIHGVCMREVLKRRKTFPFDGPQIQAETCSETSDGS